MQLIRTSDVVKAVGLHNFGGENTARVIMTLFQFNKINQIYATHCNKQTPAFIQAVLNDTGINYHINDDDLARIPKEGPFIIVANHPFGGVEGLILLNSILKIRPDFKIMANFLFNWIEPLKDYFFGVNPFETHKNVQSSYQGLKNAFIHVNSGHPLAIFPAGEVSSYQHSPKGIVDRQWQLSSLKFIKNARVPVIPVYFHGNNSWLFHLIGRIHPLLRTVKLPSEMLNKRNEVIKIKIGNITSVANQNEITDISRYGRYLRAKTYALESTLDINNFFKTNRKRPAKAHNIENAVDINLLAAEIINITPQYQLFQWQNYVVYCVPSTFIPHLTREIGRLREISFREVGEGTNQSTDIDEYDLYYDQLFVWDGKEQKIVGGYRLGKGKDIIAQYGLKGFYSHTLFRMDKRMIPYLNESIELGRSFVVKEYQRKPMSLFLLWKGILSFLLKNTSYRYLIGPVSISNSYTKISQQLMIDYVKKYHFNAELAEYVKPRSPFIPVPAKVDTEILTEKIHDFNSLDQIIRDLEPSSSKMPILLKKYLGLGGKIVCFNIDPAFNDSLDGLLILELDKVHPDIIQSLAKNFSV